MKFISNSRSLRSSVREFWLKSLLQFSSINRKVSFEKIFGEMSFGIKVWNRNLSDPFAFKKSLSMLLQTLAISRGSTIFSKKSWANNLETKKSASSSTSATQFALLSSWNLLNKLSVADVKVWCNSVNCVLNIESLWKREAIIYQQID